MNSIALLYEILVGHVTKSWQCEECCLILVKYKRTCYYYTGFKLITMRLYLFN